MTDTREQIRLLIRDLDSARADGTILTYGQVQDRLYDMLEATEDWDSITENRIHYRYGVNSGVYAGWPHNQTSSHADQQRDFEGQTSGPVDVTKRESRTVLYGPWTEVAP